jgi:hypothetical protein
MRERRSRAGLVVLREFIARGQYFVEFVVEATHWAAKSLKIRGISA